MNNIPTNHSKSLIDDLLAALAHWIGFWRVELAVLVVPTALGIWLYSRTPHAVAVGAPTVLIALVLAVPTLRAALARLLHRARVRRHLDVAILSLPGILAERRPRVRKVTRTTFGDRIELALWRGTSVDDLAKVEGVLAASLGVREVRVVADASHRNLVTLSIIRRDPFGSASLASPLLDVNRFSIWQPIPIGIDEDGEVVTLSLPERNVLIGGEPGAGKSVALSGLVTACALDSDVDLWLFDGKLVELTQWSACAQSFVGPDVERAIEVLEDLRTNMDRRYQRLLGLGTRKVSRDGELRLNVVVIDELALFVAGVDKKLAARFSDLLRDLVARGRAAGVIVLAATQKPSVDIVPSALRDLFGFRWALRCATRDASDTVLGSGWASQGFSSSDVAGSSRGAGLLLHEGEVPVRLRSFHLNDAEIRVLAARAAHLRQDRAGTRGDR